MTKKIEKGDLVTVFVTVWDLRDHIVDQTGEEGVTLRAGAEDVFPRMDQALLKHKEGDRFDLVLEPEESFGDFDENLVHLVPVDKLGGYIITDVGGGMAVLDGNHPYAGWTLRFEIQVMRVESVEEGDIAESDIFIPDFLKVANDSVKEEAEDRLEVDEARAKIAEQLDKVDEAKPENAMGTGLFTSLVPKKED